MSADAHVLVVDDEPQIIRGLKVILRKAGYEVETAESKREALDAVSVRPPDAMVLDLVLRTAAVWTSGGRYGAGASSRSSCSRRSGTSARR